MAFNFSINTGDIDTRLRLEQKMRIAVGMASTLDRRRMLTKEVFEKMLDQYIGSLQERARFRKGAL